MVGDCHYWMAIRVMKGPEATKKQEDRVEAIKAPRGTGGGNSGIPRR
jgi:hypothetical protein